jgi:hypothetical protein|tara:strand:- start:2966 stop:3271 length:306 start_codon:yes stop_codon:yes gene_type:complete
MAKTKYLICNYIMVPKNPSITSIPNWQKDPNNTQYDEQVFFDSKIRAKDASASVILNMETKTIEKNRLDDKLTYDQLHEYFYKAYKQYMDPVLKELNQVSS